MSQTSVYKNTSQRVYALSALQRDAYRQLAHESRLSKIAAEQGHAEVAHSINMPRLSAASLMPQLARNALNCLSLFSGGGGLDVGFDRAGYAHQGSFELIPICGETIQQNRQHWQVRSGLAQGDVTQVNWQSYQGKIDVLHGGPPCQPFSVAGQQKGIEDERDMWGEFIRAVNTIQPRAFVAENVLGILHPKFEHFVQHHILAPLNAYHIARFTLNAADFGAPQIRRRVFFVGFADKQDFDRFIPPQATHTWAHFRKTRENSTITDLFPLPATMGVRQALGLDDIGFDDLAPTLRSGFTGKRNTTSILNSAAGQKTWGDMAIWPNGVQATREKSSAFPAKNKHFRLSVQDCALLQGFPEDWQFAGAVYQVLGQIGNSVSPPVAYAVACSVANALK